MSGIANDYGNDWQGVTSISAGGWEWARMEVNYSPSARRYFWDWQSGCSCNGWEDPESVDEWENGDRAAAIRAIDSFGHYDEDEKMLTADKIVSKMAIRNFKES